MVDESTAEEDADIFECDSCPVAAQLDGLDPMNRRVWALYQKVATRFAADLHAGGTVLERLTREMDGDEFEDVWRRLLVLYDNLQPPPDPVQET